MEQAFNSTKDYVASEELLASVNVAIALKKPLLIKGEPGTGKTMLAEAVANSLGKKLLIWNIKSTTKAQEGLYMYDTIQRLYDGQFGEEGVDDIAKYIKLGKLGAAWQQDVLFLASTTCYRYFKRSVAHTVFGRPIPSVSETPGCSFVHIACVCQPLHDL